MRRSGGLFLILMGLTIIFSLLFSQGEIINRKIFIVGLSVSILSFGTVKYFSIRKPDKYQIVALGIALLLEFALSISLVNMLPPGISERDIWLYGSIIVGLHFLPMGYSFGKIMFFLGTACIMNASLGLLATQFPYMVFGTVDGLLKIGFGATMFLIIRNSS